MGKLRSNIFLLGITGGVGTGKSTASKLLEEKGIYRINSDEIARRFTEADSPVRKEIQFIFGEESFPEGKSANRSLIAEIAFSHPEKKIALESLLHPLIRKEFLNELDSLEGKKIVGYEVPLLFETQTEKICDATLCIYLPVEESWKRVESRGGMTREDFNRRVLAQMDIEEKKSLSDFHIRNDNTREELDRELDKMLQKLERMIEL